MQWYCELLRWDVDPNYVPDLNTRGGTLGAVACRTAETTRGIVSTRLASGSTIPQKHWSAYVVGLLLDASMACGSAGDHADCLLKIYPSEDLSPAMADGGTLRMACRLPILYGGLGMRPVTWR